MTLVDATNEFFRTLAKRGKKSLIHVWYRPDSYDTWLPPSTSGVLFAPPEPEPAPKPAGEAWHVSGKWLRDGVRYNERMNEEDYERESDDDAPAPAAAAAVGAAGSSEAGEAAAKPRPRISINLKKRALPEEISEETEEGVAAAGGSAAKKVKLFITAKPVGATPIDLSAPGSEIPGKKSEQDVIADGSLGNLPQEEGAPSRTTGTPAPAVVLGSAEHQQQQKTTAEEDTAMADGTAARPATTAAAADAEPAANGGTTVVADDDEDEASTQAALEAQRQRAQNVAKKYLAAQTQEVIIPSYSVWFDMSKINAIERRSLPEFFNNRNRSKTPSIYKDYRDFMINTYRLNPSEYLTFTACRRNLAGDVCAIMRVHAFLEQWGLINYQVSIASTGRSRASSEACAALLTNSPLDRP